MRDKLFHKALIDKYLKKDDSITEQELYEKMGFLENRRKITKYGKIQNGRNQASKSPKRFRGFLLPIFRGK